MVHAYTSVQCLIYPYLLSLSLSLLQKAAFVWSSPAEPSPHPPHVHHPGGGGVHPGGPGAVAVSAGSKSGGGGAAGGPGGHQGNPTQGLVHWMSVMAEHMNSAAGNPHHDPAAAAAVHYMTWNGVEVSDFEPCSHLPLRRI